MQVKEIYSSTIIMELFVSHFNIYGVFIVTKYIELNWMYEQGCLRNVIFTFIIFIASAFVKIFNVSQLLFNGIQQLFLYKINVFVV